MAMSSASLRTSCWATDEALPRTLVVGELAHGAVRGAGRREGLEIGHGAEVYRQQAA